MTVGRRTFLLASLAMAQRVSAAQSSQHQSLSQLLDAPPSARAAALQACLDKISALDAEIQAWVQVQPQDATGRGRLDGIPFGVKDIFETKGLATEYGSSLYKGRIGTEDAAIVAEIRRRGGILLGKTHTTPFAYQPTAPTRNPRNPRHSPGGSSSGSAAAVAAGMVPLALGTQTVGSVIRPASYCGVVGFKVSLGLLPLEGVFPLAQSLDTLGFFTETAKDMLRFWTAMGRSAGQPEVFPIAIPDPMPDVDADMLTAFRGTVDRLKAAGIQMRTVDIMPNILRLREAQRAIMYYEASRIHEQHYARYGERLGPELANLVREGLKMPVERYDSARRSVDELRTKMAELFSATPVILFPAATSSAPLGIASNGDARLNGPWTALGAPCVSVPMPVGERMPLGIQVAAEHGQDARALQTAIRLEEILGEAAPTK